MIQIFNVIFDDVVENFEKICENSQKITPNPKKERGIEGENR